MVVVAAAIVVVAVAIVVVVVVAVQVKEESERDGEKKIDLDTLLSSCESHELGMGNHNNTISTTVLYTRTYRYIY